MPHDANNDPRNRRKNERHAVRGEARIEPLDEHLALGAPKEVSLQDIGLTGVMFQCDGPLPMGSKWRLRFIHRGNALAMIPVIVRYCAPLGDCYYHIGAQFAIEPAVLSALGVEEHELNLEQVCGTYRAPANRSVASA